MMTTVGELDEKILQFFGQASYPGDENIVPHRLSVSDSEADEIRLFFTGKDWRDLTFDVIAAGLRRNADSALCYLTEDAFCYFYPSFLRITLRDYTRADAVALAAPFEFRTFDDERRETFGVSYRRWSRFSRDQLDITLAVFQFVSERDQPFPPAIILNAISTLEELTKS